MPKLNRLIYKIVPILLVLIACSSKATEKDRKPKNDAPNFIVPATILSENSVKNLLPFVRNALFVRP